MRQKKDAKKLVYMAMGQKAWEAVDKLILVLMVVSCLELPNKGLGRRHVGDSFLEDENGAVKL